MPLQKAATTKEVQRPGSTDPFERSGSKVIEEDKVGFLTDPDQAGRTSFRVEPGDVIRARATVSTNNNFYTKLTIFPSRGSGPVYEKGAETEWVQGKNVPLRAELRVPEGEGFKYVTVSLDQPNWTEKQLPEDVEARTFQGSAMTGGVSWSNAKITINEPLSEGAIAGVSTTTALTVGGVAVAGGILAYSMS